MPRRASIAAALLVVLAGCGSSAGEKQQVRETVNGLYKALSSKDAHKFCASLTERRRKDVAASGGRSSKKRSCEQVMTFAFTFAGGALREVKDAKVKRVELDGSHAKAVVEFKGKTSGVGLAKEGGRWRISDYNLKRS